MPFRSIPVDAARRLPPPDDPCLAAICYSARILLDVSAAEISMRCADGRYRATRDGSAAAAHDCVAEIPVTSDNGLDVCTLSLFDPNPRRLSQGEAKQLKSLAMVAAAHVSLMHRRETRESEAPPAEASRYRALAHALPQMIWVMRATDGEAIYVNRRFEDFYGPIGRSAAARLGCHHPDDEASLGQAWEFAKQGRTIEMEGRLRRQDGQYRWHKLVMIPVRSGDTVVEWIGTALDIDEIVRAHKKIEDATGLLRLAQTAAGAGVWEWMIDSEKVRLSPEIARMHGIAPEMAGERGGAIDISLQRWMQTVHRQDFIGLKGAAALAVQEGGSFTAEFRVALPTSDGGEGFRWLQTFGQLLRDAKTGRPDRLVGLSLDVTERKEAQHRIEHMALHDSLTGLPNRALFRDRLAAAIQSKGEFALLLCDLDGFKGVNDTLGHAAGDALLQIIATRLQARIRSVDTVARLGGDEFAVLLGGIGNRRLIGAAARRIIDVVSRPVGLEGRDARVGMSIGIAIAGAEAAEIDNLLKAADTALYRAKAAGRNTHRFVAFNDGTCESGFVQPHRNKQVDLVTRSRS